MKTRDYSIPIKMIAYQVIFLLLHYAYDWFPNSLTKIFSGIDESIFQHMKVAFYSYIIISIIEYFWLRKKSPESIEIRSGARTAHFFSRLFATTFIPWTIFVFYFMAAAYYGEIDNIPLEILYANLVLLLASYSAIIVERHIQKAQPGTAFKVITGFMFLVSFSYYIIFTYRLPWFDVFAIPPGW